LRTFQGHPHHNSKLEAEVLSEHLLIRNWKVHVQSLKISKPSAIIRESGNMQIYISYKNIKKIYTDINAVLIDM